MGSSNGEEEYEEKLDDAIADFLNQRDCGLYVDRETFLAAHPDLSGELRALLEAADCIEHMAGPTLAELNAVKKPAFDVDGSDSSNATQHDNHNSDTLPPNPTPGGRLELDATLAFHSNADVEIKYSVAGLPTADSTQPNLPCRFGEYVLERVLGRGGMGVVYIAKQLQLDRQVAIKMIRSGCLASNEEVQRFYAEARSAAKLDHPNIVTVYQCGECEGHHYFSMDYVPGTDLARRISSGPLDPRDAARYVRDVARAIAYAHEHGVLHRDLKPANVLIDERDQVVITDFGLAKLIGAETGLTATGAALGTPSYMSPEQAGGRSEEQSQSTDVYSLGAILFATLTGRPPFQSESVVQTIMQVVHKPAPMVRQMVPQLHADLETITAKCLQKQPQRRYESANHLADDLDRFLLGQPIQARPQNALQRIAHWSLGIPLVGALTGHRTVDPSVSHRWAQRSIIAIVLCISFVLMVSRQSGQWWAEYHLPYQISIAAGNPDGMYHDVATHLAQRLNLLIGHNPLVVSTNGSTDNLERLLSGKVQLALLQASSVRSARVAVVAPLYYEAVHLLVHRGVDAENLEQLKGKRLALGPIDSGTRLAAKVIFDHFGLEDRDFKIVDTDWNQLANNQSVDAAMVVIKPGHFKIGELLSQQEYRLLPIHDSLAIQLNEPTFRAIQITTEDYPSAGFLSPIPTLASTAFLSVQSNASARLVRAILESLYQKGDPLPGIMTAQRAAHWQGLAWHPAAREFFENLQAHSSTK